LWWGTFSKRKCCCWWLPWWRDIAIGVHKICTRTIWKFFLQK
jgi:hypothetical protein